MWVLAPVPAFLGEGHGLVRLEPFAVNQALVWCEQFGHRHVKGRAVAEVVHVLHSPLAVGLLAHQDRPATGLQRASDDLRAAGRPAIHQDHEGQVHRRPTRPGGVEALRAILAPLVDHRTAIQELAGDAHSDVQKAPGVPPQVQDQVLGSGLPQFAQGLQEFRLRPLAEEGDVDVACVRQVLHEVPFHRGCLNLLPPDGELQVLARALAVHGDVHSSPHRPPHEGHHLVHRKPLYGGSIHGEEHVALLHAGSLRGLPLHGREGDRPILPLLHPGPDAAEVAAEGVPLQFARARLHQDGVGVVQDCQDTADGRVGESLALRQISIEVMFEDVPRLPEQGEPLPLVCLRAPRRGWRELHQVPPVAEEPVGHEPRAVGRSESQADEGKEQHKLSLVHPGTRSPIRFDRTVRQALGHCNTGVGERQTCWSLRISSSQSWRASSGLGVKSWNTSRRVRRELRA